MKQNEINLFVYDYDSNLLTVRVLVPDEYDEVEIEISPKSTATFEVPILHSPRLLHHQNVSLLVCTNRDRLVNQLQEKAREKCARSLGNIRAAAEKQAQNFFKSMEEVFTSFEKRMLRYEAFRVPEEVKAEYVVDDLDPD